MTHKTYNLSFRRKRTGKTNYRKRLTILKSRMPRLVVKPSNKNILLHVVSYQPDGDKSILSISSQILNKSFGWKFSKCNIPSSYLTGLIAGKELGKKGIKKVILDLSFNSSTKGSKVYAALKGVLDAGIEVPHSKEMLADEDRIKGKVIEEYAALLEKSSKQELENKFSLYLKNNANPKEISKDFEETKKKILAI